MASAWASGAAQNVSTDVGMEPGQQLLSEARDKFGLDPKSSGPFHLKAQIQTFDEKGKPAKAGTFEEYSDGAGRSHTETTYGGRTESNWKTPALYTSGAALHESFFMRRIVGAFLQGLPTSAEIEKSNVVESKKTFGALSTECLTTTSKVVRAVSQVTGASFSQGLQSQQMYCFSLDSKSLRVMNSYPYLALVYNKLTPFEGREIPYSVTLSLGKVIRAKFDVDILEPWKIEDATLVPPADAVAPAAESRVSVHSEAVEGNMLSKTAPVYPLRAKELRIQGSVVLAAIISRLGDVDDLELLYSPDQSLTDAAMEAVKRWKYKPYLLNGEPVEVDTVITVNFAFSRR
jgi:TonB family protein